MNSSDAPPPVETWVSLSARPACSTAWTDSPPPTIVVAAGIGHRVRHAERAGGEARVFEDAHRAVPEHGAGLADLALERLDGPRPDVDDHLVRAAPRSTAHVRGCGVALEVGRHDDVDRQHDLVASAEQVSGGVDQVGFEQTLARLRALRP